MVGTQNSIFSDNMLRILRTQCWKWPGTKGIGRLFFSEKNATESSIDIIQACYDLRSSIQGLNDKFKGPLDQKNAKNTMFPFVFLLGNHSSGKSSFINYLLGKNVQTAGVAPTDDTFTIIAPGKQDQDRDGPALIGCFKRSFFVNINNFLF